jgi:hypothetical protein
MKDIKKIAKEYREQNGNERITNKELLWYMIGEFDDLKTRVTKTEATQRLFKWGFPIAITVVVIIMGLM